MRIDTAQDWWNAVDDNWDDLLSIIGDQMIIDAPAHEIPGNAEAELTGRTILQEVIHLKKTRGTKLARYFAASWCLSSDSYAWSVPGWGVLCDLCSEEWVLYEEERSNQ